MASKKLGHSIREQALANAATIRQLDEHWPAEVNLSALVFDEHILVNNAYTSLFVDAFQSIPPEKFHTFSVGSLLFGSSLLLIDQMMDRASSTNVATVSAVRIQAAQWEGYHLLHTLFPPEAPFWARFRLYLNEFTFACTQEKQFGPGARALSEFTEPLAFDIIRGKNGLARSVIAGLVELTGQLELLEPLTQTANLCFMAEQMWDDLCDWQDDLRAHIPSLLLARFVDDWPTATNCGDDAEAMTRLARELYYGGHASYILGTALDSLSTAEGIINDLPEMLVGPIIRDQQKMLQDLLQDIEAIVDRNRCRIIRQKDFSIDIPVPKNEWERASWATLRYLADQWRLGFGEARHIAKINGYKYGDVLQRSLVADALCDVSVLVPDCLRRLIDSEVDYMLSQRVDNPTSGWRYFPDLAELPVDADLLAQMIRVLVRSGRSEAVESFCGKSLSALLDDHSHVDGSFDTWITGSSGGESDLQQVTFVKQNSLHGRDDAVIANLLHALCLFDPTRFAETIDNGVSYLEWKQMTNGHWSSVRYNGPYIGTYYCLRFLSMVCSHSTSIARAVSFIRTTQHNDGGWGIAEGNSDALSTAHALLALASVGEAQRDSEDIERAKRGIVYLLKMQNEDGSWPRYLLMRQELLSYGSQTVTSVFALQALIAWMAPITF